MRVEPKILADLINEVTSKNEWTLEDLAKVLSGPWNKKTREHEDGTVSLRRVRPSTITRWKRTGAIHQRSYEQLKALVAGDIEAVVKPATQEAVSLQRDRKSVV